VGANDATCWHNLRILSAITAEMTTKRSRASSVENRITSKTQVPKALREQVWINYAGRIFERKCLVPWCQNIMTVFDFHVGHDVPESRGGATDLTNLRPICSRCNLSMGSQYTVQEWSRLSPPVQRTTCLNWIRKILRLA